MSDAPRAQALLREAREILSQRLTELVLASEEEILADARGDSYMNEIETLYEQVGLKLAHVSQMLSHLPHEPATEEPQAYDASPVVPAETYPPVAADGSEGSELGLHDFPFPDEPLLPLLGSPLGSGLIGPLYVASHSIVPHKPSPSVAAPHAEEQAPHASFGRFVKQVQLDDLSGAGRTLAALLGMDFRRSVASAAAFAEQLQEDPHFFFKVAQLQMELQTGSFKGARGLLIECFALTSDEATAVLYNQKLIGTNPPA